MPICQYCTCAQGGVRIEVSNMGLSWGRCMCMRAQAAGTWFLFCSKQVEGHTATLYRRGWGSLYGLGAACIIVASVLLVAVVYHEIVITGPQQPKKQRCFSCARVCAYQESVMKRELHSHMCCALETAGYCVLLCSMSDIIPCIS